MALLDSLLSAIVRADGDALVMHVGERPYVVVGTQTINISTHGLNLEAMTGMLTQLLPAEPQTQLEEFGAVEYRIPQQGEDRFSVVAARGGDDIWIEIRRRRQPVAAPAPTPIAAPEPIAAPVTGSQLPAPGSWLPDSVAEPAPEAVAEAVPEPATVAAPEPPQVTVEPPQLAPELPQLASELPQMVAELPQLAPELPQLAPEPLEIPQLAPEPPEIPAAIAEPISEQVPVFAREISAPPSPEVAEPIAPEPAAAAEPVEAIAPPAAVEQILEEAPKIAALAETLEAAHTQEILEEAPQIAALAETLEAAHTQEILEEAPKIAALVETLEAPVSVQQVHEVHAAHSAPAAHVAPPVERAAPPVERVAPPVERVERVEPVAPEEHPQPVERIERLAPAAHTGEVVPMMRTVRIEVPPRTQASSRAASGIDRLLRVAAARGASALFLTSDSRPWIRVEGDLRYLDSEAPWSRTDVESAILEIAPESGQESIGKGEPTEWLAEFEGVGRIRCTTFHDHRGPGVLLRMIATRAATAEQLGLSPELQALATEAQGIVLVAGPRASGKSTLLSALVDLVNRQRAEYVITLERQIRLVHDHRLALVSQREIRGGAEESVVAARAALRESPDVLVVDDLVSSHMVPLLLSAASEGLLIFVSITAPSTADAVERFVELAPPEMRKAVQNAMAESFRGAVAQVLLKKAGGGLVAAREVLLATAPVTRVIDEGQLAQLPLTLESGRKYGMVSFTDVLADYVRAGTVDVREAFRKAPDRNRLLEILKRDGVDTSAVERLA